TASGQVPWRRHRTSSSSVLSFVVPRPAQPTCRGRDWRRAAQADGLRRSKDLPPALQIRHTERLSVLDLAKPEIQRLMYRFSRRSFLAGSAAAAAVPALAAPRQTPTPAVPEVPRSRAVDAVIVGAGTAGIAAARRLVAAGKRIVVIEAADEVGGRCITDTRTFGIPYDRGAHWIYSSDINPLAKLSTRAGVDIYPAPPGQRM